MAAAGQQMPAASADGTYFNAGRGASEEQSLGGVTGAAINLLNGLGRRLQQQQQLDVRDPPPTCCHSSPLEPPLCAGVIDAR